MWDDSKHKQAKLAGRNDRELVLLLLLVLGTRVESCSTGIAPLAVFAHEQRCAEHE